MQHADEKFAAQGLGDSVFGEHDAQVLRLAGKEDNRSGPRALNIIRNDNLERSL